MAGCGCSETCNCVIQGGEGITTTGTGAPGNPLIINATGSAVTVADTDTVDLTKTGNVITGDVRVDPIINQNLITSSANGLAVTCEIVQDCVGQGMINGLEYLDDTNQFQVKISGDPGNTLNIGSDDGVFAPSSPVTLGCGLELGGLGEIQVNTVGPFSSLTRRNCDDGSDEPGTTPLPGPDTAGMEVYCDAAGDLRTKPEKFTEVGTTGINEAHLPAVTALPFTTGSISLPVTNPSSQYCMCGYVTFAVIPALSGAPGTVIQINHERDMGDGIFLPATAYTMDNRGKSANAGAGNYRMALPIPVCLAPGETKTIRHRVTYLRGTGDNGGAISITATAREIYFVGTNI